MKNTVINGKLVNKKELLMDLIFSKVNPVKYATELSVLKWEQISENRSADRGSQNCALCLLYHGDSCMNCPIAENTGQLYCIGTPYIKFCEHIENCSECYNTPYIGKFYYCKEARDIATEFKEYLTEILEAIPE